MTKRKILIISIAIVVAGIIVVGAVLKNRNTEKKLPEVSWTKVTSKNLEETVSASGDFVSRRLSIIQPSVSGRVQKVHVIEGQHVAEGDLLISLEDRFFRNALEQARVTYETTLRRTQEELLALRQAYIQARDSEVRARDSEERTRDSYNLGSVSKETWQLAEEAVLQASMATESARRRINLALGQSLETIPPEDLKAYQTAVINSPEVRGAALAVQAADEELKNTRIIAPEEGYITNLNLNPGDLVSPQVPLCRVESLDEMIAEISIDEVDIGKISLGDPVIVTSDSLLGRPITGQVESIAPVVQKIGNLRAAAVKIALDHKGITLRAGASCLAKIEVTSSETETVIPVTAFFSHTGALWTYKIVETEDGEGLISRVLEKTQIELGRSSLEEVVVTSGLSAGDLVAVGNLSDLRDGLEVQLIEENEDGDEER